MTEKCTICGSFLSPSTIISNYEENSSASLSNLKINDEIIEIDRVPITSNEQLTNRKSTNSVVTVKVKRNNIPMVFLVRESEFFFSKEIQYKNICKKCYQKENQPKTSVLKIFAIALASLGAITILLLLFMLINANKKELKQDENQIIISEVTNIPQRINSILLSSEFYENKILENAEAAPSTELFQVINDNEMKIRKMFTYPNEPSFLSAIVLNYNLSQITQEKLDILAQIKATTLGTIYYDYGEWILPSDKYPSRGVIKLGETDYSDLRFYETAVALNYVLATIPEELYSKAVFVICGHTDSVSNHAFNQVLSENRAASVKKIMVDMFNIPSDRIITKGYSWDKRAVPVEKKPIDFAMNRRAEIKVCFFEE